MHVIGIEARRIQRFVLASPRLRDMVGASELVERACRDLPRAVLRRLGASDGALRFGAAGRAWIVLDEEDQARHFARIWPAAADAFAPGLDLPAAWSACDGTPQGEREAVDRVREALRGAQAWPSMRTAELSPLVERSQRTGGDVVRRGAHGEMIDEVAARQEAVGTDDELEARLGQILMPPSGRRWPRDMERIVGEEGGLAVVHADGNAVGRALRSWLAAEVPGERPVARLAKFSDALRAANEAAVRRAFQAAVYPAEAPASGDLPARPLVIGGDDVTVLARSDLALPFVRTYVAAFEKETTARLGERLTACAGVAVVQARSPFRRAYALAESLCDWAKDQGRAPGAACPSLVAFHRVTGEAASEYRALLASELQSRGGHLMLTRGPFALSPGFGFPTLASLEHLADALERFPRGPRRQLLTELAVGGADVGLAWSRTRELCPDAVDAAERALREVHGGPEPARDGRTPLLDAHAVTLFRRRRA